MDANPHPDAEEQLSGTAVVGLLLRRAHRRASTTAMRESCCNWPRSGR